MEGLYESVPLKDALIIWQDHASNEMKEKYKSVLKKLQSSKVKEQMILTLYLNKFINRKQLIASLTSITDNDESLVGNVIDAIKALSVNGHRPQMVLNISCCSLFSPVFASYPYVYCIFKRCRCVDMPRSENIIH